MKKILILFILSIGLSSCVSTSSYSSLKDQYDSITQLSKQLEVELYQTDSLVASVLGQFQQISHIENMINVNIRPSETPRSEQERIRENMQRIYEQLDRSSEMLDNLSRQLEINGSDNARLTGTIAILRLQIEQQREHVARFEQEVGTRTTTLQVLDSRITGLRREAKRIRRDQELFDELLLERERVQNRVHYCIGTIKDLQEMGIYRDGEVGLDAANLDYLTISDEQALRELPLQSRKARLRTIHPSNTYVLTEGEDHRLKLEIRDPEGFWSYSRVLIVEVE